MIYPNAKTIVLENALNIIWAITPTTEKSKAKTF